MMRKTNKQRNKEINKQKQNKAKRYTFSVVAEMLQK